jgi:hypothetical protein
MSAVESVFCLVLDATWRMACVIAVFIGFGLRWRFAFSSHGPYRPNGAGLI